MVRPLLIVVLVFTAGLAALAGTSAAPDVVIVTIDTLRADRLSAYGYERATTPNLDRVLASGLAFRAARTVEPLTAPASVSMLTSVHPHDHGTTRNGLRMRGGLASLPKQLRAEGYGTAAFVGNWTLRNELTGLAEHFDKYEEVLTRKRWWGLLRREAGAADLNERALAWVAEQRRTAGDRPLLLWVHYTEPHAPYVFHRDLADALGIDPDGDASPSDRYDTEIAFADRAVGLLLEGLERYVPREAMLLVVASDHGESLGEHDYWGHGRNLYEPNLRIPLGIAWEGRIEPRTLTAPALNLDIAPTVLGLLGLPAEPAFEGFDWSAVLRGAHEPHERLTHYQAHRGAVLTNHDSEAARRAGLLLVAQVQAGRKEILDTRNAKSTAFDLDADPRESYDVAAESGQAPVTLVEWLAAISTTLGEMDVAPPASLDEESIERLRALGYAD